jgi:hypothetical protein
MYALLSGEAVGRWGPPRVLQAGGAANSGEGSPAEACSSAGPRRLTVNSPTP